MSEKKPDNVVHSEEEGYNASLLPYSTNVSAPAIKPDDVSLWKNEKVSKTNHYFKSRYEEIKEEYRKLIEMYEWNKLVYESKFSFTPIKGEPITYISVKVDSCFFLLLHQTNGIKYL